MKKRVFAVCSGSGGVGKSTFALAVAMGAASSGMQTILLDASGASRSCDLMLGMESIVALDLTDVLSGQASLSHAIYRVPQRDKLQYCCTSLLGSIPFGEFAGIVLALRSMCDILVIDLPTGELALADGLLGEDDARICLARPDDASLRSMERIWMRISGEKAQRHIILSRIKREAVKRGLQYSEETAAQILDSLITGCVFEDEDLAAKVGKERAGFLPTSRARAQLDQIIRKLLME